MRFVVLFLCIFWVAASNAQPPFLFTPQARTIEPRGMGWRVDLGAGDVLEVTGSGTHYTARASGREVASYWRSSVGWREMPGGALWMMHSDGRWVRHGSRRAWTLTPTATGFQLDHSGGRVSWYRTGLGFKVNN